MSWDEPATARDKLAIARLCIALKIREELEQRQMSRGEARTLRYELLCGLRAKPKGGYRGRTDIRTEMSGGPRLGDRA